MPRGPVFAFWICLGAALLWDWSGLDVPVMRLFGTPAGFALAHHWWLETVLHQGMQRLATVLYLGLWLAVWWPFAGLARWSRHERLGVVLCTTLALLVISGMKQLSLTSCPSGLVEFGGTASHVSHWAWGLRDGGSGHCFPGGHASSAMGFVALAFPLWARRQRGGWWVAGGTVALGLLLGLAQTLRGAHYPSHTLWTLVVCAAVSAGGWQVWQRLRLPPRWHSPAEPQVQR